jgi:hypothetical protein
VGAIEGAFTGWRMMVFVLVDVRPFWSVATYVLNGVGCRLGDVGLDGVHRRTVDIGLDAECARASCRSCR